MPNFYAYDAGGILRRGKYLYAYDSIGTLQRITAAYAYDAAGVRRKIFPETVVKTVGMALSQNTALEVYTAGATYVATGVAISQNLAQAPDVRNSLASFSITAGWFEPLSLYGYLEGSWGSINPNPTVVFDGYIVALNIRDTDGYMYITIDSLAADPGVSAIDGVLIVGQGAVLRTDPTWDSYVWDSGNSRAIWRWMGVTPRFANGNNYNVSVF